MERPYAYMPIDRRLALAKGLDLPEWTHGAALFADISGFTPLTEMLARQLGPRRGAEELTHQLNRVYNSLITGLHNYGGSVIGFSGDAITCWLDGDDGSRGTAVALGMQAAMLDFTDIQFGDEAVSLALKTAVVVGPVRRFIIGDPDYLLIDVLAGATLQRLTEAEHLANKGEVIIDSQTVAALGDGAQIKEWRSEHNTQEQYAAIHSLTCEIPTQPWPSLPDDGLKEEQTQSWLLPAIYRRLQTARGAFLAELRPASALFLRFGGIDYDNDDDAPQKLNAFVQALEKILARYSGSLLQLTIGDKGSYLYAAMGAPIAHEDNVDRNLRAAWEMQQLPQKFDFLEPLQIGVTYGRMYAGAYGGQTRRTYGVLGDAVNLSARLMQAAQPGQILVNDEAFAKASPIFFWETLPTIHVKGKSEPVTPTRLVGIKAHRALRSLDTLYPQAPIGREEILSLLNMRLAWLLRGHGQVIRIIGEAGMGKTHVAAEFSRRAEAQGVRLVLGTCQNLSRNSPYSPWREVFYALLDLDDDHDAQAIAQLTAFLQEKHPDWLLRLPLLGDILNLPIPDNPTTAALDRDVRQKSLFSLLVDMLQTWAQAEPLMLILDNTHWMDEASEALTQTLARQVCQQSPLLIMLLHRPALIGETASMPNLAKLSYFTALLLDEMRDKSVAQLIQTQLGTPPAPLLLDVVQTMAHGNPFFVRELITAMHQEQQIQEDQGVWQLSNKLLHLLQRANFVTLTDGTWQLKEGTDLATIELGLPDSIHGLVLSHLDRLPEAHKLTLKVSSILGYYIDLLLVTDVHPEEKEVSQVEAEAAYMEAEEVVHEEMSDRKIYTFRQHTIQEVAYQTLLHTQRQQLHRAVASALDTQYPEAITDIAHHAYVGELWTLALNYNLQAGARAKQLYANQQSIDYYQKALDSAQGLPDTQTAEERKHIHLALGELLITIGRYEPAHDHLEVALSLAQTQNDRETEARCYRWFGRSYERRSEFNAALAWLNQGINILSGLTSPEEAEMSLIAGLINVRQGHYDIATQFCQRSLQVAQALDDIAVRARTYNLLGIIDRRRGDSAAATERFSQALTHYEDLQNVYGQATSHNSIANAYVNRGAWTRATRHYRRALDLFTQIGSVYSQVIVNNNLGEIARKQGRLEGALGYYQRARRLSEQIGGSLWMFGTLHLNMGNAHLYGQNVPEALTQFELAQSYFDQVQQRDFLPELWELFAEAYWLQGDLDMAESYALKALNLARELKMTRDEGRILRVQGEIAHSRQQFAIAEQYFQEGYTILNQRGDEYHAAKTKFSLAKLYLAQQQVEAADVALADCEPVFARLEAQLDITAVQQVRQTLIAP